MVWSRWSFRKEIVVTWFSIFFFSVLAQGILFWFRGGWLYGTDAYYLATFVQENAVPKGYTPLFYWFASIFAWNSFLPWFLPCLFVASLALLAGLIARYYAEDKHGLKGQGSVPEQGDWCSRFRLFFRNHPIFWGAWLCFGIPSFIFRGFFFEEDFLGLIFVFSAIFFAQLYLSEKDLESKRYYFLFHVLMVFLGLATWWRGTALFFPLFCSFGFFDKRFRWWLVPTMLLGVLLFVLPTLIPIPNLRVWENLPGLLYIPSSFLLALVGLSEIRRVPRFWMLVSGYTFFLALYLYKFAVLFIVPLAVLCYLFASNLPDYHTKKIFRYTLNLRPVTFFVQAIMVGGLIAGFGGLYSILPDAPLMNDLEDVVSITGDDLVANEWRYGHWLYYLGGNPEFSPLNTVDFINQSNASWVLGACEHGFPVEKEYKHFCLMYRRTQENTC